jgi:hypothetical protein
MAVAALALAGCGGGTDLHPNTKPESAQPPAPLPAGWHHYRDYVSGFSLGVPPGSRAERRSDALRIGSPDRLVAVSVTADRTDATLAVPLDRLATASLSGLPGYDQHLRGTEPVPLGGTPLDSAQTTAVGVARATGVPQRVTVVALRRDHLVNYTTVVAANARSTPAYDTAQALQIGRTIRDVPPAAGGVPGA